MTDTIWLSWESHRRNQSISRELGIRLFEITDKYPFLLRYPILLFKTFMLIKQENAKIIFVQNPSVVLSLFTVIMGKFTPKAVIVDAHNIGIRFEHPNLFIKRFGQILNHLVIEIADLTIVTNSNLAEYVKLNKGKAFVLPDPFPIFRKYRKLDLKGEKNILYICTFSPDEPYLEVFKAAEYLKNSIYIYVSGNNKRSCLPNKPAQNIIFTGYIPEQDYINYLHSVDAVIDLTYREDCLVCGAYEAIAAEKPLLLSDKTSLKGYFGDSALYTDNTASDISCKIKKIVMSDSSQFENVMRVKFKRTEEWLIRKKHLKKLANEIRARNN